MITIRAALSHGMLWLAFLSAMPVDSRETQALVENPDLGPKINPSSCRQPRLPSANQAVPGPVKLQFIIDERGRLEPDSIVVLSSAHPALEAPAIKMLKTCKFVAARLGGKPVRARLALILRVHYF